MSIFSNIWQHPKTSMAGLLLCVITIAGVLSGQGITLGKAGTGTVVALIAALGTALLGLLAKDPGSSTPAPSATAAVTKVLFLLFILPALLAVTACKTNGPLPPGALTAPDATIDATLSAASAAVTQYEKDVAGGFVPAPALRTSMQDLQKSLAVAIPAYQAWHAELATNPATAEPAALVSAVASIITSLGSLPSSAQ